jgi:putative nucleotidyltransferase with HDIG domain
MQDPRFDEQDVFDHMLSTCDHTPPIEILRWAGLLHDIGKPTTQRMSLVCDLSDSERHTQNVCKYKSIPCNISCKHAFTKITFYSHEMEGGYISRRNLARFDIPEETINAICKLVILHMYYYTSEWSDKSISKFITRAGIPSDVSAIRDLYLFKLREAERMSRGLSPTNSIQMSLERRIKGHIKNAQRRRDVGFAG